MARIPLIHPEAVDGDLADFFTTVDEVFGRVPNSLRTMAHAPLLAMLLIPFNATVQREWPGARLSGKLKELVVIKTSQVNGCEYCFAHNTALGEAAGITHEQVIDLSSNDYLQSDRFDERERVAIEWAEAVTRNTAQKDSALYERLKVQFSDGEIVELTLVCAMFNMINRFNDTLGIDIEVQSEINKIKPTLAVDPQRISAYLHWLADHWPGDMETLNREAEEAAAA